jgi:hypothetical protein
MHNSEKFVNWLEGYLDASKNKLTAPQVREIRKKISEYHTQKKSELIPLWDSAPIHGTGISGGTINPLYVTNSTATNEEFLKEIEKNKSAATMEELSN